MTRWPLAEPTRRATEEMVRKFMEKGFISPFVLPSMVRNYNAARFLAKIQQNFMKLQIPEWNVVLAYAPVANGRAEKTALTTKRALATLYNGSERQWDELMQPPLLGYGRRLLANGFSSLQLLYG